MFSYTSVINEVASLLSQEDLNSFKNNNSYNKDAKELCDRIVESIQAGKNLAYVRKEFNWWLSKFELDAEEESGTEAGETRRVEADTVETVGEGGSTGDAEAGNAQEHS